MSPMTAGIVLSTVALLVQGTRCLLRQGAPLFVRRFGALTLLLAGLSAVLFVLLHFGEAVLSPEFDTVMARGHRRGLTALVLGLAVTASLGLHVQRLKAERPGRLGALLALGVGVGLLATMRITTLNPEETEAFRIYAYDLWWPPLLVWVSVCFLDGAITILGMTDHRVRAGAFAALLLGLSSVARHRAAFGDPTSERLWAWVFGGGVALSVAVVVLLVRAIPGGARGVWSWLASAPSGVRLAVGQAWRHTVVEGWHDDLRSARARMPLAYGRLLGLLALATIAATLIDIFYLGRFSHVAALIVLAIAWTCLAEVTAEGPLRAFVVNAVPAAYDSLVSQQSRLGAIWSGLRAWLGPPLRRVGGAAGRLLSLRPLPEGILKLSFLLVAVVVLFEIPNRGKTLLQPFKAAVVKSKENEVAAVEQQAAIGQAVFDHIVNTLGALTQDLQPDVILLLPPDPLRGAQFRTIAAGGAGSIDPFLSGPPDLDLGLGIKVPIGLFLTPIVKPIRWLLGVRIIDGSVLADPQGYTVLVRSSSGEVWQARLEFRQGRLGETELSQERLTPASAFRQLALELAFRIMSAEPALASLGMTRSWEAFDQFREGVVSWQRYAVQSGEQDPDALTDAIRRFRAAIGLDPAFALAHYRLGLALKQDGQPIAAAEALRTSLKANPGFVPARVALASVLYGLETRSLSMMIGPTELWRRSVRPARDAMAPSASPAGDRAGGAMDSGPEPAEDLYDATLEEAQGLWQSVVAANASPLDRAAAWAGLCRHAFERGVSDGPEPTPPGSAGGMAARWIWPTGAGPRLLHAAYFDCKQADRFYTALLAARPEDVRVRAARASVLASMGLLLEQHGPQRKRRAVDGWQCSSDAVDPTTLMPNVSVTRSVHVGRFTRHALRYYQDALGLLPDDTVLRCREATAALALGASRFEGERLMRALKNVAAAHLTLADSYQGQALRLLDDARFGVTRSGSGGVTRGTESRPAPGTPSKSGPGPVAAGLFQLAFEEYREALGRDPTSAAALNQFARVFWEWRRAAADKLLSEELEPTLAQAREAEWNARRAVAMVEAKLEAKRERPAAGLIVADRTEDLQKQLSSVPSHLRPIAATALGGLGAVLLAQARPHEAVGVLASAQTLAPQHPRFDDVRSMLGQAILCAASREFRQLRQSGDQHWRESPQFDRISTRRQEGAAVLERVREHQRTREGRPFASRADFTRSPDVCRDDWLEAASKREGPTRYVLKERERGSRSFLCGRLGVRVDRFAGEQEPLYLRVWGGSVERLRLEATEEDRRSDMISLAQTTSRFYYFAQLENEKGRPLSAPLGIDPTAAPTSAASPSPSGCRDAVNLITLTISRSADPGSASPEARGRVGLSSEAAPPDGRESGTAGR